MALTYVGHPDFVPTQSSPIPTYIASLGTFAPGASWGPISVSPPSGGAYAISVAALTGTNIAFTDITVKHLDFSGNVVWEDFFGAVMNGSGYAGNLQLPQPTFVRGNVYGATLQVSGTAALSAFVNGIISGSGYTASSVVLKMYILPNGLSDPDPKLSNGSALLNSLTGSTPGNLLCVNNITTLTDGTATARLILVPYSGAAVLSLRQAGVTTTPANVVGFVQGYTVANGTTPVYSLDFATQASALGYCFSINLAACVHTWIVENNDGAQTANLTSSIVGVKSA
jgi:hypothetical protein